MGAGLVLMHNVTRLQRCAQVRPGTRHVSTSQAGEQWGSAVGIRRVGICSGGSAVGIRRVGIHGGDPQSRDLQWGSAE